ncbi:hypothetical protein PHYSODRAFT_324082 [Phytophthora sojae]|uniref:Uncharacterized protein n=1 Tax=Phytophthora sojae (strain P6497) TaxID=1094619 RepID=G4YP12_PHYSP|nr:hypothetical protein PHYSODRAFT_324082 [Phytophthora sojae]EGZ30772.1 hypothetical protein PHYSODRAFT_324082 [Phytophthora sojae]|eukprot:XP_009518047.1 hypothetical protein PHYSODRAFT_324082 [Phytophthora sojae]
MSDGGEDPEGSFVQRLEKRRRLEARTPRYDLISSIPPTSNKVERFSAWRVPRLLKSATVSNGGENPEGSFVQRLEKRRRLEARTPRYDLISSIPPTSNKVERFSAWRVPRLLKSATVSNGGEDPEGSFVQRLEKRRRLEARTPRYDLISSIPPTSNKVERFSAWRVPRLLKSATVSNGGEDPEGSFVQRLEKRRRLEARTPRYDLISSIPPTSNKVERFSAWRVPRLLKSATVSNGGEDPEGSFVQRLEKRRRLEARTPRYDLISSIPPTSNKVERFSAWRVPRLLKSATVSNGGENPEGSFVQRLEKRRRLEARTPRYDLISSIPPTSNKVERFSAWRVPRLLKSATVSNGGEDPEGSFVQRLEKRRRLEARTPRYDLISSIPPTSNKVERFSAWRVPRLLKSATVSNGGEDPEGSFVQRLEKRRRLEARTPRYDLISSIPPTSNKVEQFSAWRVPRLLKSATVSNGGEDPEGSFVQRLEKRRRLEARTPRYDLISSIPPTSNKVERFSAWRVPRLLKSATVSNGGEDPEGSFVQRLEKRRRLEARTPRYDLISSIPPTSNKVERFSAWRVPRLLKSATVSNGGEDPEGSFVQRLEKRRRLEARTPRYDLISSIPPTSNKVERFSAWRVPRLLKSATVSNGGEDPEGSFVQRLEKRRRLEARTPRYDLISSIPPTSNKVERFSAWRVPRLLKSATVSNGGEDPEGSFVQRLEKRRRLEARTPRYDLISSIPPTSNKVERFSAWRVPRLLKSATVSNGGEDPEGSFVQRLEKRRRLEARTPRYDLISSIPPTSNKDPEGSFVQRLEKRRRLEARTPRYDLISSIPPTSNKVERFSAWRVPRLLKSATVSNGGEDPEGSFVQRLEKRRRLEARTPRYDLISSIPPTSNKVERFSAWRVPRLLKSATVSNGGEDPEGSFVQRLEKRRRLEARTPRYDLISSIPPTSNKVERFSAWRVPRLLKSATVSNGGEDPEGSFVQRLEKRRRLEARTPRYDLISSIPPTSNKVERFSAWRVPRLLKSATVSNGGEDPEGSFVQRLEKRRRLEARTPRYDLISSIPPTSNKVERFSAWRVPRLLKSATVSNGGEDPEGSFVQRLEKRRRLEARTPRYDLISSIPPTSNKVERFSAWRVPRLLKSATVSNGGEDPEGSFVQRLEKRRRLEARTPRYDLISSIPPTSNKVERFSAWRVPRLLKSATVSNGGEDPEGSFVQRLEKRRRLEARTPRYDLISSIPPTSNKVERFSAWRVPRLLKSATVSNGGEDPEGSFVQRLEKRRRLEARTPRYDLISSIPPTSNKNGDFWDVSTVDSVN